MPCVWPRFLTSPSSARSSSTTTTTMVIEGKGGGGAAPPPSSIQTPKKTFSEDLSSTFSSPLAWILVLALVVTWSCVFVIMFDLMDYKTISGMDVFFHPLSPLSVSDTGFLCFSLTVMWKWECETNQPQLSSSLAPEDQMSAVFTWKPGLALWNPMSHYYRHLRWALLSCFVPNTCLSADDQFCQFIRFIDVKTFRGMEQFTTEQTEQENVDLLYLFVWTLFQFKTRLQSQILVWTMCFAIWTM